MNIKLRKLTKDKKGITGILLVVVGLFLLMFIALLMIIGSATINYIMDIAMPELTDLGMIESHNLSQTTSTVLNPIDTFVQNLTWVVGIVYIFGVMAVFGVAFVFRSTGEKWLMALFISLVLILVIASIFVSNIYEELIGGTDDLSLRMKEHTLLSYLILYSPLIITIIAFLSGIILFSGTGNEEVYV